MCIQKQSLKKYGEEFEFSSSGLQTQLLMQLQRCAQFYLMKKLFLSNYKQNRGPWDNIKLLLIESCFVTSKIFNLFMQTQGWQLLPRSKAAILLQQPQCLRETDGSDHVLMNTFH